MSEAPTGMSLFMCLLLAGILVVSALVLLWFGYRPRRVGDMPHCPRCDYNLTGLTEQRCPECGTHFTPDTIVYGERRRKHPLIILGVMLLLCVAAFLYLGGRQVNGYLYKPAAWVLGDLQSSNRQVANRAFVELRRRDRTGSLSSSAHKQFLECCLAAQAVKPPAPFDNDKIEYLTESLLADGLSAEQKTCFFEQSILLELKVRPRVIQGEDVPIIIERTCRMACMELYIHTYGQVPIVVDNQPSGQEIGFSSTMSGLGAGGGAGARLKNVESGPHTLQLTVGQHALQLAVPYKLYHGSFGKTEQSELLYEGQVPLKANFEVLASEPPDYFRRINDPSIKGLPMSAIQPGEWKRRTTASNLDMEFKIANLPINVAFEVAARANGKEYPLTTFALPKGKTGNYELHAPNPPSENVFDVILRSSEKVARQTVDLFEIWEGELVYEGVVIENN